MEDHGINDFRTVEKYRLGYVADPLPGDEGFHGRIAIPYLSKTGVVNIKFRRIGEQGPKYLYHPGQKHRLYNTNVYHTAEHTIGLCEGEIDAIVATERLRVPTMGIPGSKAWQGNASSWRPIFKDFRRVFVFADGDDAGSNLASEVAESLGFRARVVQCDPGFDVASTVTKGDLDRLQQLIKE